MGRVHPHVRSHQAPYIARCVTRTRRARPWPHTVRAWVQGVACLCTCPRACRCGGPTATASCPCRPSPGRPRRATTPRTAPSRCAPAPDPRIYSFAKFSSTPPVYYRLTSSTHITQPLCPCARPSYLFTCEIPSLPPVYYLPTSSTWLHPCSAPAHNTSIHTNIFHCFCTSRLLNSSDIGQGPRLSCATSPPSVYLPAS